MSRLYYAAPKALAKEAAGGAAKGFDINDVAEKVAKLVPAELITAYTAFISFAAGTTVPDNARPWCYLGSFFLCLILTPLYLNKMADPGKPKKAHLIVSSVAFVVWAYFTSGQQVLKSFGEDGYSTGIASMILLGFSLITALIPIG